MPRPRVIPFVSGKHPQDGCGESNGTGEKVPLGWGKGCSNVGGPLGEMNGTGKLGPGAARHRIAQRQLDFASKAAGLSIDKRDSVPAVFGQVALCIADDE